MCSWTLWNAQKPIEDDGILWLCCFCSTMCFCLVALCVPAEVLLLVWLLAISVLARSWTIHHNMHYITSQTERKFNSGLAGGKKKKKETESCVNGNVLLRDAIFLMRRLRRLRMSFREELRFHCACIVCSSWMKLCGLSKVLRWKKDNGLKWADASATSIPTWRPCQLVSPFDVLGVGGGGGVGGEKKKKK